MPIDAPLIVPPGEHKLVVRAEGKQDAERSVRVASGDEVEVTLKLVEKPAVAAVQPVVATELQTDVGAAAPAAAGTKRFALGAGFGTNLLLIGETGVPSIGVGFAVHPRIQ